jgi:GTP-binding nuclear protein Ran
MSTKQAKCVLIGDTGVGKTTYIKKLLLNFFDERFVKTLGVEVHPLEITYSRLGEEGNNSIVLHVWDCAGDDRFGGLRSGYWIEADMAIIMFHNLETLKQVMYWYRSLMAQNVSRNIPIVFVYSQYSQDAEMDAALVSYLPFGAKVFKINTQQDNNLYNPLTYLLRKHLEDPTIYVNSRA